MEHSRGQVPGVVLLGKLTPRVCTRKETTQQACPLSALQASGVWCYGESFSQDQGSGPLAGG